MAHNRASRENGKLGGRPKGALSKTPRSKALIDVKALAAAYTQDALDVLSDIMRDAEAPPAARVAAARELLDRGHGRPAQAVEVSGVGLVPLFALPAGIRPAV